MSGIRADIQLQSILFVKPAPDAGGSHIAERLWTSIGAGPFPATFARCCGRIPHEDSR